MANPEQSHEPNATPPSRKRSLLWIAFPCAAIGATLPEIATGGAPAAWGWVLLLVGGLAAGVAFLPAFLPNLRTPSWFRRLAERLWTSAKAHKVLLVLVSASAVAVGLVGALVAPGAVAATRVALYGCPHPVELRVLTSPERLATLQEVADEYERWIAGEHRDCPTANLFVYAAPFEGDDGARDSLSSGWPEAALKEWPRPDVWIADSSLEVEAVDQAVIAEGPTTIAATPVVLGVPATAVSTRLINARTTMTWAELLTLTSNEDDDYGWTVVRPDPQISPAGRLATAALHADGGGFTDLERHIALSMDGGDYPHGDETAILCRHRTREPSNMVDAVIVSEQALLSYNQGRLSGPDCQTPQTGQEAGAADARPAERDTLVAFYPSDTLQLDPQFVRLAWDDATARQADAAVELGEWLTGPDGRKALLATGLRPPQISPRDPISDENGALPTAGAGSLPDANLVDDALQAHQDTRRPGQLLVVLDTSGSMKRAVDDKRTRFNVAADAVIATLDIMTSHDQYGLWTFPSRDRETGVRRLIPIGAGGDNIEQRRRATESALDEVPVRGGTPLFAAIATGVQEVDRTDRTRATGVVAITDGEDTGNDITADDLASTVGGEGSPRVFIIATGEARCASQALIKVTSTSGGLCREARFDKLERPLTDIARVLWGGGESRER